MTIIDHDEAWSALTPLAVFCSFIKTEVCPLGQESKILFLSYAHQIMSSSLQSALLNLQQNDYLTRMPAIICQRLLS